MCGIAGLVGYGSRGQENMERMKARMVHRGPDADGTWVSEDGSVVLGHQRLSILDLSEAGAQPVRSRSGRFLMTYNGEIYNYRDIKQRLLDEKKVSAFRSSCDTEVLLEAIEAYGMKTALAMCKGMFAIGVYDTKEQTITLARDRVGEKPLYYGMVKNPDGGRAFAFSSDVGSIAALESFDAKVNREVLDLYFELGYIPAPYSIYEGIYKLLPGTILTVRTSAILNPVGDSAPEGNAGSTGTVSEDAGHLMEIASIGARTIPGAAVDYYWSMTEAATAGRNDPFKGTREEAADELERLLRASIRGQSVADVPLGAFLSAGIDSSTIVSLMQAESGANKVRTFTIGMEDPKYNEAAYAKEIAAHLGTEHTELYITDQDAKNVIPLLPAMFSEPFADSSEIPTYLVSKMTRQHVTVSLSGDAGDELFCGYVSYGSMERKWNKNAKIPAALRSPAGALLSSKLFAKNSLNKIRGDLLRAGSPEEMYRLGYASDPLTDRIALHEAAVAGAAAGVTGSTADMTGNAAGVQSTRDKILHYPRCSYTEAGPDTLGEVNRDIQLVDLETYHPDDILVKVDRTAMAVSLETRVPLLDRDVVEFAWTLPIDYLRGTDENGNRVGKLVLRDVLYRYVPREMMDRPKKGFSIPLAKWLKGTELRDWAESLLDRRKLIEQGYLDADVVRQIWEDFTERGVWRVQIWYILMFEAWLSEYPLG